MAFAGLAVTQRDLECPICQINFNKPRILPCGHTFCGEPCLVQLAKQQDKVIICPECRARHKIPKRGVSQFPRNIFVTRLLLEKENNRKCAINIVCNKTILYLANFLRFRQECFIVIIFPRNASFREYYVFVSKMAAEKRSCVSI